MNFTVENINNKFNDPKWLAKARIDLNCIPKMVELGFEVQMNHNDKQFGRTTVDNVPMFPVSFQKDNYVIWKVIDYNSGATLFRSSYLINSHYVNHKTYNNIDDAVAAYCNKNDAMSV